MPQIMLHTKMRVYYQLLKNVHYSNLIHFFCGSDHGLCYITLEQFLGIQLYHSIDHTSQ